ncbi:MAG: DUF885 domain-containing protein [Pyrinomonadaceae bacterium]|nr:DUF885 domain-containing protein [Pyrinomonadaceae bacterium]
MSKRFLLLLTMIAAIAFGCVTPTKTEVTPAVTAPSGGGSADQAFKAIHDKYVVEFLRRNPTVNTYLGGAGLDASLRDVDGSLRDHTPAAINAEDTWLAETQKELESVDPNSLSAPRRIDREVALAQIRFLLHQHRERRYQERALDTYTDEPFRAIDWQLQGMTQTGEKSYGTPEEWALVTKRLGSIPRYLSVAQEQLAAGIKSGNTPDHRMLRRNGIETSEANAKYFEQTLPALAAERLAAGNQRDQLLAQVRDAARQASAAYIGLRDFVKRSFFNEMYSGTFELTPKPEFSADRYAMGEDEYNRALKNNLRIIDKTASQLYDESWPVVERTRNEMIDLARKIGERRGITLPADGAAAVRAIFDELSKDYPKSDAEMVNWYREASFRLVDYARKTGIFDVPADYKLDVVETPPPLQASIDGAAYYPAPPFKNSGVGRFYVTPTNNDTAALKSNNRASLADLAAHEGFPGHDWHYKVLTQFRDQIAPVRWLTAGAVEDSSSMWQDSVASEGWGLYAEALMAEPQPGAPEGFYTPEERLYQLQGKLYRDLRVRIDTGIHTGRIKYDEAVNLFSEVVDFLPGTCGGDAAAKNSEAKQASCKSAERAIFRYSKWPTQAITYRLGKEQIYALRDEAARIAGDKFSPKAFHLLFMKQGTIPAGYFREELLREVREGK